MLKVFLFCFSFGFYLVLSVGDGTQEFTHAKHELYPSDSLYKYHMKITEDYSSSRYALHFVQYYICFATTLNSLIGPMSWYVDIFTTIIGNVDIGCHL